MREDNDLKTDRADYQKLHILLSGGQWKLADELTRKIMLEICGCEKGGWFSKEDLEQFPIEDLRMIDRLWVSYSKELFGFSVQKKIWLEEGGNLDEETENRLTHRIGWKQNGEWLSWKHLTFDLTAPIGHLPAGRGRGFCVVGCGVLLSRENL